MLSEYYDVIKIALHIDRKKEPSHEEIMEVFNDIYEKRCKEPNTICKNCHITIRATNPNQLCFDCYKTLLQGGIPLKQY